VVQIHSQRQQYYPFGYLPRNSSFWEVQNLNFLGLPFKALRVIWMRGFWADSTWLMIIWGE